MATATKVCRVCGKSYEACRSANRSAGVFRWQEVACSPECGEMYLELINESRGIAAAQQSEPKKQIPQPVMEPVEGVVFEAIADELAECNDDEPTDETPVEEE